MTLLTVWTRPISSALSRKARASCWEMVYLCGGRSYSEKNKQVLSGKSHLWPRVFRCTLQMHSRRPKDLEFRSIALTSSYGSINSDLTAFCAGMTR